MTCRSATLMGRSGTVSDPDARVSAHRDLVENSVGVHSSIDERDAILRNHLRELSDLPLLSDGEELAAAAVMADGRSAENELAALGGQSSISLIEASDLMERVRMGEAARDELIGSTRRLVVSLARRHPSDAEVTKDFAWRHTFAIAERLD